MKKLIRKILKEEVMYDFIESAMPELNNLSSKIDSTGEFSPNTVYYDKETDKHYFRVLEPRMVGIWGDDGELKKVLKPKTLLIDARYYNEIMKYIPDEEMVLKWFNKQYDENVESVRRFLSI
jgi:Zn-finger nucleic acid-binding protein